MMIRLSKLPEDEDAVLSVHVDSKCPRKEVFGWFLIVKNIFPPLVVSILHTHAYFLSPSLSVSLSLSLPPSLSLSFSLS